jgi:hypothetical protein
VRQKNQRRRCFGQSHPLIRAQLAFFVPMVVCVRTRMLDDVARHVAAVFRNPLRYLQATLAGYSGRV